MHGLALVLLVLFGLVAVVLRAAIQWRRTGSTGIKGFGGARHSRERVGGLLFVLAIALSVSGAGDRAHVLHALDRTGLHVPGAALAIAALIATAAAQLAMGESWRIGVDPEEETRLVTGGPFAVVRNPIYAGMIPFFLGIALMVPTPLTIAGVLLLVVALEFQTRFVEEPYLRRVHGDAYDEYAARVGRFVPGMGLLRR